MAHLFVVACISKHISTTCSVCFKLVFCVLSGYLLLDIQFLGFFCGKTICLPSAFLSHFCMVEAFYLYSHPSYHVCCCCPSLKLNVQNMNWSQSLSPRIISMSITLQYPDHDGYDFEDFNFMMYFYLFVCLFGFQLKIKSRTLFEWQPSTLPLSTTLNNFDYVKEGVLYKRSYSLFLWSMKYIHSFISHELEGLKTVL